MFLKIVFLFTIGGVLAESVQVTPADLNLFFNNIDVQVRALQSQSVIQIQSNKLPLERYIANAKDDLVNNINQAAVPYWATIQLLNSTYGATAKPCLDLGNSEIYALNASILNVANQAFNQYNQSGNEILDSSSAETYSVIQELAVLEQVVVLCNDVTCATTLYKTVTDYYQRAKNTVIDAETKSSNYVIDYLPTLLAQYDLNTTSYVSNYTVFITDVQTCLHNM